MFTFIETRLFTRLVLEYLSDEHYAGYRVIYYVRRPKGIIWMLTMYPKNVADSIPAHVLREIREELGDE